MIRPRSVAAALSLAALVIVAGCSTSSRMRGGGYYKDDGPGLHPPANIDDIPDAVPRIETHLRSTRKPYVVFGKRYVPLDGERPFRQEGTASWYGKKFHGEKTASGETYDMYAMTAAHPTLPIPSYAKITRPGSGKSVIVRINDRGPFHSSRIIDLSYAAAARLGIIGPGSGQVIVQAITNDDIRHNTIPASTPDPAPAPVMIARQTQPPEAAPTAVPDVMTALDLPASPPLSASPPEQYPAQSSSQIYLQFGAFSQVKNARSLVAQLNQDITQVESRSAQVRTAGNLHRVLIGPYPTRTAAVNAALRIGEVTSLQPTMAEL